MLTKWQPNQTKFKRLHKGIISKCQYRLSTKTLQQGFAGLRILKSGRCTAKQLEQVKRKLTRERKKRIKQRVWLRCIPDIPLTAKSLGLRMGKGKGAIKSWVSRLLAGKVIIQINHITRYRELKTLYFIRKLLPIPTKIVVNKANYRFKLHSI